MQTITIAGAKGGTGKTTTTTALAYELARLGHRIMIADCDPQAMATQGLRQKPANEPLVAEPVQLEFDFGPQAPSAGSILLARGGRPLAAASRAEVAAHLRRLVGIADILVVDTVATIASVTLAALGAANLVIVPTQAAPYSMSGLIDALQVSGQVNATATIRGLLTQVNTRRWLTEHMVEAIDTRHPGLLYQSRIPDDARCERATLKCLPIGRFDPRSRSAVAYRTLAREVLMDLGLPASDPCARAGTILTTKAAGPLVPSPEAPHAA